MENAGRRRALLLVAFLLHPLMAAMGISFCCFLTMALLDRVHVRLRALRSFDGCAGAAGMDLRAGRSRWRKALDTRTYYYLYKWTWYEWLGALAPLFFFWLAVALCAQARQDLLARFALGGFCLWRVPAGAGHVPCSGRRPWCG